MEEYTVEIVIDEDGNITAETKGIKGEVCVEELDAVLKGLEGEQSFKNKPEYYQKSSKITTKVRNRT